MREVPGSPAKHGIVSWSTPGYDELGQVLRKMGTLLVTWEHKTRLRRPGRMGRCQPNFVPSCCRCCR